MKTEFVLPGEIATADALDAAQQHHGNEHCA